MLQMKHEKKKTEQRNSEALIQNLLKLVIFLVLLMHGGVREVELSGLRVRRTKI